MSVQRDPTRRACVGKFGYAKKRWAKRAVRSLKAWGGAECEPYRCVFCGAWHLGNKLRRAR